MLVVSLSRQLPDPEEWPEIERLGFMSRSGSFAYVQTKRLVGSHTIAKWCRYTSGTRGASRGYAPPPNTHSEKCLIAYKYFNYIAQKISFHPFFMIILWFFAMNTKYICKSVEKLLRYTLDTYIYHIYEVLSYCSAPLNKKSWFRLCMGGPQLEVFLIWCSLQHTSTLIYWHWVSWNLNVVRNIHEYSVECNTDTAREIGSTDVVAK